VDIIGEFPYGTLLSVSSPFPGTSWPLTRALTFPSGQTTLIDTLLVMCHYKVPALRLAVSVCFFFFFVFSFLFLFSSSSSSSLFSSYSSYSSYSSSSLSLSFFFAFFSFTLIIILLFSHGAVAALCAAFLLLLADV
jgi:hypothetical protein